MRRAKLLGEKNNYGRLFNCVAYQKRFEELLYENKIHNVVFSKLPVDINELLFDELTLVILPSISDIKKIEEEKTNLKYNGDNIIVYPSYVSFDEECVRIKHADNIIIGDYYKFKNLLILYFNLFPFEPRTTIFKKRLKLIFENVKI